MNRATILCGNYAYLYPRRLGDLPTASDAIMAAGYDGLYCFVQASEPGTPDRDAMVRIVRTAKFTAPPVLFGGAADLREGLDSCVERYRRVVDFAAALGAPQIVDCGGSIDHRETYLAMMRLTAAYAASKGTAIAMKPHGDICLSCRDMIDVHREVDHPAFGLCLDPGNLLYYSNGQNRPEDDLEEMAPLVTVFIAKDCVLRDDGPEVLVVPGTGLVDFPGVWRRLVDVGYEGPVCVEKVPGDDLETMNSNFVTTLQYLREQLR